MQNRSNWDYLEFVVLNYIDIKYVISSSVLIDIMSKHFDNVEIIIVKLIENGYIREHEGSYSLSEMGKEKVRSYRREIVERLTSEEKNSLRLTNNMLNEISYFLQYTVTKYQLKADSQKDIIKSLEEIYGEITLHLKNLLPIFPHLKIYLDGIYNALLKIREGNTLFIVHYPNSYYYMFYELHADIKSLTLELEQILGINSSQYLV